MSRIFIAKFNLNNFLQLDQQERNAAKTAAENLFGHDEFFVYRTTPAGGNGGWVVIVKDEHFSQVVTALNGPLSQIFTIEDFKLNNPEESGFDFIKTMVPIESTSW